MTQSPKPPPPLAQQRRQTEPATGATTTVPATTGPATTGPATSPAIGAQVEGLALPHERDQSTATAATAPDPVIEQAKRDIDAGLVDTDMRATPGLDAKQRAKLVPGSSGTLAGKRG